LGFSQEILPKIENCAHNESARFTWQTYSLEVLARIHPSKITVKPQALEINQNSEEGGRERGREKPN
jgi:hypothetical protein